MSDIKKDVKAIVKIYVQIFVSTLIQVSTKQMIKNLSNLQKKRFEAKVRYMSDDQLAQYFEENPYFEYVLHRTINPGYDFQPAKRKESVIGKLISVFEEINYFNNPINALLLPTRGAILTAMSIILITSAASIGIVTSLPPVFPPVANFTSNITNGEVPLEVQFNDSSTGGKPLLWYWDFGDNKSSTDRNLTHTYNSAGNYTVKLKVINIKGLDSKNTTITVLKLKPKITWSNPTNITYETVPNDTQLNAFATDPVTGKNVTGKFTYYPGNGTKLSAGTHILDVKFTPVDIAIYTNESFNVTIDVSKACPITNWNNLLDIVYGTPLSKTQLNATANVNGTFNYNPAEGTVLEPGSKTLNATFIPTDAKNYTNVSLNVSINVKIAEPKVNWDNPDDIIYGTSLSDSQLNARTNVPGNFTYDPVAGTKLSAGKQTLHVDFTPTNDTNYTNASKSVMINITKVTPEITWSKPADITYGTALDSTQLNANATVNGNQLDGTFIYNPAEGTVLDPGSKTLNVTFIPTDAKNYTNVSLNISINVLKVYAYITNKNDYNVSVIDTSNNTVVTTVTVGYPIEVKPADKSKSNTTKPRIIGVTGGDNPYGVAVTPDGTEVYVANARSSIISVIDTATKNVKNLSVESFPEGVAISPDGAKVYVTHPGYDNVSVIDTATKNVTPFVHVGRSPHGVAVSPDGKYVYVANRYDRTVSVINTATKNVKHLNVESIPEAVAVSPDGKYVYVTNSGSQNVYVILTTTNKVTPMVTVRDWTYGVTVSPDGTKVYVTHPEDDTVSVIDTAKKDVIIFVPVGRSPHGVAVTPDGKYVYVANSGDNTISVIDTVTNTVTDNVTVGKNPESFGQFIGKLPIYTTSNETI